MSNAYKEWEKDKIDEEKRIVAKYPFLRLRDIDGTIDTESKFPMIGLEIPNGFEMLFFQMCEDIKLILEKHDIMDDFYFIQVKEKYGMLCCHSTGAPREVHEVIAKYEQMSQYICSVCGKPAAYETTGWIEPYCEDCWKDKVRHCEVERIEFKPYFTINTFTEGVHCDEKKISFKDEWDRYIKGL